MSTEKKGFVYSVSSEEFPEWMQFGKVEMKTAGTINLKDKVAYANFASEKGVVTDFRNSRLGLKEAQVKWDGGIEEWINVGELVRIDDITTEITPNVQADGYNFKEGDEVKAIDGAYKGKVGKVLAVFDSGIIPVKVAEIMDNNGDTFVVGQDELVLNRMDNKRPVMASVLVMTKSGSYGAQLVPCDVVGVVINIYSDPAGKKFASVSFPNYGKIDVPVDDLVSVEDIKENVPELVSIQVEGRVEKKAYMDEILDTAIAEAKDKEISIDTLDGFVLNFLSNLRDDKYSDLLWDVAGDSMQATLDATDKDSPTIDEMWDADEFEMSNAEGVAFSIIFDAIKETLFEKEGSTKKEATAYKDMSLTELTGIKDEIEIELKALEQEKLNLLEEFEFDSPEVLSIEDEITSLKKELETAEFYIKKTKTASVKKEADTQEQIDNLDKLEAEGWEPYDVYRTPEAADEAAAGYRTEKGSPYSYLVDTKIVDEGEDVPLRYTIYIRKKASLVLAFKEGESDYERTAKKIQIRDLVRDKLNAGDKVTCRGREISAIDTKDDDEAPGKVLLEVTWKEIDEQTPTYKQTWLLHFNRELNEFIAENGLPGFDKEAGLVSESAKTFKCPTCGTNVLDKTKYCVKCKKKVEPKGGSDKKETSKVDDKNKEEEPVKDKKEEKQEKEAILKNSNTAEIRKEVWHRAKEELKTWKQRAFEGDTSAQDYLETIWNEDWSSIEEKFKTLEDADWFIWIAVGIRAIFSKILEAEYPEIYEKWVKGEYLGRSYAKREHKESKVNDKKKEEKQEKEAERKEDGVSWDFATKVQKMKDEGWDVFKGYPTQAEADEMAEDVRKRIYIEGKAEAVVVDMGEGSTYEDRYRYMIFFKPAESKENKEVKVEGMKKKAEDWLSEEDLKANDEKREESGIEKQASFLDQAKSWWVIQGNELPIEGSKEEKEMYSIWSRLYFSAYDSGSEKIKEILLEKEQLEEKMKKGSTKKRAGDWLSEEDLKAVKALEPKPVIKDNKVEFINSEIVNPGALDSYELIKVKADETPMELHFVGVNFEDPDPNFVLILADVDGELVEDYSGDVAGAREKYPELAEYLADVESEKIEEAETVKESKLEKEAKQFIIISPELGYLPVMEDDESGTTKFFDSYEEAEAYKEKEDAFGEWKIVEASVKEGEGLDLFDIKNLEKLPEDGNIIDETKDSKSRPKVDDKKIDNKKVVTPIKDKKEMPKALDKSVKKTKIIDEKDEVVVPEDESKKIVDKKDIKEVMPKKKGPRKATSEEPKVEDKPVKKAPRKATPVEPVVDKVDEKKDKGVVDKKEEPKAEDKKKVVEPVEDKKEKKPAVTEAQLQFRIKRALRAKGQYTLKNFLTVYAEAKKVNK